MTPETAYHMGHRTAGCGFFFDGMEMVAAASPQVDGGIDAMRGALELLFAERDRVNEDAAWVAHLVSRAFGRVEAPPTTVDGYRTLQREGVFEIVNRWSYIADIKQVTQLQAWFYAGFGLGRGRTVTLGLRLFERLRDQVGVGTAVDQMPDNLQRMAAEAARQMAVAAEEDDLRSVRPLFEDAARRVQRTSVQLLGPPDALAFTSEHADDLVAFEDAARKIALDLAPSA